MLGKNEGVIYLKGLNSNNLEKRSDFKCNSNTHSCTSIDSTIWSFTHIDFNMHSCTHIDSNIHCSKHIDRNTCSFTLIDSEIFSSTHSESNICSFTENKILELDSFLVSLGVKARRGTGTDRM